MPQPDSEILFVEPHLRPPGTERVKDVEAPEGKIAVRPIVQPAFLPAYGRAMVTGEQAQNRLENILAKRSFHAPTEGLEEKRQRELREADVVEAARRSQAEIRRHVDSYLKEHYETIAADIAEVVIKRTHETILKGIAGMQEQQLIQLDRIASDVRAQLRAFVREGWVEANKTPKPTRKAKIRGKR